MMGNRIFRKAICFLLVFTALFSVGGYRPAYAAATNADFVGLWSLDYLVDEGTKILASQLSFSATIQLNADGTAVSTTTDAKGNINTSRGTWGIDSLFLTVEYGNNSPDVYLVTEDGLKTAKNELMLHFARTEGTDSGNTIYCPQCGKKILAGSKFCMFCGHSISGGGVAQTWGAWSAWSTTPAYESGTRQVETRTTVKGYNMFHYRTQYRDEPHPRVFRDYSINGDYDWKYSRKSYGEKYQEKDVTASELSNAVTYSPDSKNVYNGKHPGYQDGTTIAYGFSDDEFMWFIKSKDQVTEYRYRDLK